MAEHEQLTELKTINASLVVLIGELRRSVVIEDTVAEMAGIIQEIHLLVNSEKTAGFERELSATKRELLLLEELGRPASVIQETKTRIQKIEETLSERASAQAKIDS
jgi:hypothetical protein